jgi:hypothetical protein
MSQPQEILSATGESMKEFGRFDRFPSGLGLFSFPLAVRNSTGKELPAQERITASVIWPGSPSHYKSHCRLNCEILP